MKRYVLITLTLLFISVHLYAYKTFLPWNNRLSELTSVDNEETIPMLLGGSNYRIIKISDFNTLSISRIRVKSSNTKVEIYQLPQIEDHTGTHILDLVAPCRAKDKLIDTNSDKYFLLKFTGIKSGNEQVQITLKTKRKKYSIKKNVIVSNNSFENNVNINVWAYFNYTYLTSGIKNQMIEDMVDHNINVLVLPPYRFPAVEEITARRLQLMREYLDGTKGKFKYYILFLGYKESQEVLTPQWKKNLPLWYEKVMEVFNEYGIDQSKVLIYPYDEPKKNATQNLIKIYKYFRKIGIMNSFFSTLSYTEALPLARNVEFIQVHSGETHVLEKVKNYMGPQTELWLYEAMRFRGSRNISAASYLNFGFKAFKYDAKGIGVWNYAAADNSLDDSQKVEFKNGKGSWEIKGKYPNKDFSLVYRKHNTLYPSLRYEALRCGIDEYNWLEYYELVYDEQNAKQLSDKLSSGKLDLEEWEKIKLQLVMQE